MREYSIAIRFTVDAHDYDEAIDIAKLMRMMLESNAPQRVRDVETVKIEEV